MIARLIHWSIANRFLVLMATVMITCLLYTSDAADE